MELVTITTASHILNVSTDTIRRWHKKGLIQAQRDSSGNRLFNTSELDRLKNRHTCNGSPYRILSHPVSHTFTSIDLFAGCGGTALGLENAGFRHILVNEIDKNAVETLQHNRPQWNIVHDDIKNLDFTPYYDQVDVIEGGFPCQAFSYAGKSLGFDDQRGTLFREYARAVQEVMPRIFMAENVPGLVNHNQGLTLGSILDCLKNIKDAQGRFYHVTYKIVHSQYFDVPQKRSRLIILGKRSDIDAPLDFPTERNYIISLREALQNVPTSVGQQYSAYKKQFLQHVPPGGYWRDLPLDMQKQYMGASFYHTGGRTGMARRLAWDEPCLTLTCSPSQKQTERCHPEHTRPLTIREYARIQTFPDDYNFCGSISSQYKQIGNAVPVNLAYHVGRQIYTTLYSWDQRTAPQPSMHSLHEKIAVC